MRNHLSLFLPGLLSGIFNERQDFSWQNAFPALRHLLSRATCQQRASTSIEQGIKSLFSGLAPAPIPAGALGALHHGLSQLVSGGQWCRLDLIECLLDQQTAYVLGNENLGLTEQEEIALLEQLNAHLQSEGIIITQAKPLEWYCYVPQHHEITLNDLLEVVGKSMHNCLPSGPHQTYWHRLMTECQMLLASSPVNTQRQQQAQPTAGSVWFWGLGVLPQQVETVFDHIYTSHPIMGGLAKCAGKKLAELPSKFNENIFHKGATKTLVADFRFIHYFKHQLYENGFKLMHAYEENWFKPLLNALNEDKLHSLIITVADGREFKISKKHLKYFWRKTKPFQAFLQI